MTQLFRRLLTLTLVVAVAGFAAAGPVWAGKATIIRDDFGVPHVFAKGLRATWFGVGYAMAQDRLWQADLHRRQATGTLAEYFGSSAIAGDAQARLVFGPRSYRRDLFKVMPNEVKRIFRAYRDGINAWIAEAIATGQLPVEYAGLGLPPPREWTVDDSIAWAMAFSNGFGESGASELAFLDDLSELIAINGSSAGPAIFFDSHWLNDPTAFPSAPAAAASQLTAGLGKTDLTLPDDLPSFNVKRAAAAWERAWRGWRKNAERIGFHPGIASNAIAISPELSATGDALLLAGPQMGYSTPQIIHEVGVHGGGFNVNGMAIAGVPGVAIGTNRKVAWTFTTGGTDNNDIYVETLNPDNPAEYFFGGSFRPFDCRLEAISVRGVDPVPQMLCRSVHGPVIAQVGGVAFTLKSATQGAELSTFSSLLRLSKANSIRKVDRALKDFLHCFNILAADTRGNIYYRHNGRIPIRAAGDSPFFPHLGDGRAEWQGYIPFNAMPHSQNPDQGWLVSWNNKPQTNWFNSNRGFNQWGPVARVQTLANVLQMIPRGAATIDTIENLNLTGGWTAGTPSGTAQTVVVSTLLGDLLGHVDAAADSRLADIVGRLASWNTLEFDLDNNGVYDGPEGTIFNAWWDHFINRVFADELGSTIEKNVVANMAARLLRPGLVPLNYPGYLGGQTPSQAVTSSLVAAVDHLTSEFGSADPADWLASAGVITWDAIGAVEVPDTPWMNRGTYNQITRLEKGDIFAQNVIAPGQSGNPLSSDGTLNPHFADQLFLYATWQYKQMYLTRKSLKGHRESRTVLRFGGKSKKKSKKSATEMK